MRLAGKTALITGAASGLGAATARRFAEEGANVCVADILQAEAERIVMDLQGSPGFQQLDVCNSESWEKAVAATVLAYGRLDILVNNAGVGPATTDLFDDPAWERQMAVNAKGTFLGIKAAVPAMQSQGGGAIVNISSITAKVGQGIHFGYASSKAAVLGMTRSAAVQFAADGIRINAVLPGIMPPMRNSMSKADPAARQRMVEGVPLGRMGKVDDVANAVLFLASDEAQYITGVELPVDGGYLAR